MSVTAEPPKTDWTRADHHVIAIGSEHDDPAAAKVPAPLP
jgi:hypothetical protein